MSTSTETMSTETSKVDLKVEIVDSKESSKTAIEKLVMYVRRLAAYLHEKQYLKFSDGSSFDMMDHVQAAMVAIRQILHFDNATFVVLGHAIFKDIFKVDANTISNYSDEARYPDMKKMKSLVIFTVEELDAIDRENDSKVVVYSYTLSNIDNATVFSKPTTDVFFRMFQTLGDLDSLTPYKVLEAMGYVFDYPMDQMIEFAGVINDKLVQASKKNNL
jgi:hypothetical protein